MSNARILKGKHFRISADIIDRRKKLLPKFFSAKKAGKAAYFRRACLSMADYFRLRCATQTMLFFFHSFRFVMYRSHRVNSILSLFTILVARPSRLVASLLVPSKTVNKNNKIQKKKRPRRKLLSTMSLRPPGFTCNVRI